MPKFLIDRDGDAANTGTGFGKPAKDLSINYVPVPYPDYPPATIEMKPGERQLWRVLECLGDHLPQPCRALQSRTTTSGSCGYGRCADDAQRPAGESVNGRRISASLPARALSSS
jgi:hypothetical protein